MIVVEQAANNFVSHGDILAADDTEGGAII
jgi:hypothetical protein